MKKFETEMLNLTYECLTRYWQKDYKFVISYCAKEVIWCGARQDEFMLSREVVEDDFRTNAKEIPPCHLLNAEFLAKSNASLCVITGNYRVWLTKVQISFCRLSKDVPLSGKKQKKVRRSAICTSPIRSEN